MTEQDNVQTAQGAYAAFGRGDIPAVLETLADDIEWISYGPADNPILGTRHGKQDVAERFRILGEELEFHNFQPREFIAQGDKVVVLIHSDVTVRRTGRPVVAELAHVATYRDGKAVRFEEFSDTAALVDAYRGG